MYSLKIKLNSMEEIVNFSYLLQKYPYNFDIKCSRQMVDAKSILGIMTLNYTNIMDLHIHVDSKIEYKKIKQDLSPYITKEKQQIYYPI